MFKKNTIAFLFLTISACAPNIIQHGNLVSEDKIAYLKTDYHTKDDVVEILGPPSSFGLVDKNKWYYIGRSGEQIAFFAPDIEREVVLRLDFNDEGTLQQVTVFKDEAREEISPNKKKTKAGGHDLGIFEQVFGNFGRRYQQEKK